MTNKIENYLSKIVKYGLYAILLTPLAFWPQALYGFLTPKFILFQVLVEIVFDAWLILFIKRGFTRIWADLRGNYIVLALLLFFAVSFISAFLGIDFSRSFWGIGARMTGLFAEVHFLAWFLVLASVFRSGSTQIKTQINADNFPRESATYPRLSASTYLNFSFFVALIVAATAFYQSPQWVLSLGSTIFNNPTFVAPYLLFHFFWGIYQIFSKKNRWLFGTGSLILFTAIILGQVRGAIVGLIAGAFFFSLLLVISNLLSRRKRIVIAVCISFLILLLIVFWNLRQNEFIRNIPNLSKISSFSLVESTVQTRLLVWNIALKGFGDMPILGAGPENFNYLFNTHYNPRLLKFGGGGFGETWFDKPHNAFLEILAETGIIGFGAYILILAAATLALYKLWKSGEKFLPVFLASVLIAYLGSVFFAFDSFGSWFGLYLFLAFLAVCSSDTNTRMRANDVNNSYIRVPFVIGVAIFVIFLMYVNYGIWRANVADADALRAFSQNPSTGIALFKKSLNYYSPYKSEYQFDFAASVIGAVQKNIPLPDLENNLNFILDQLDNAIKTHPLNAAYYTDLVRIYDVLGTMGRNVQILSVAEDFGKKSLELSPKRQETLYYLSQNAALKGDSKLSIEWGKQAVDAEPTVRQSHWYLGLAYLVDNQREKGFLEIKKALELGYGPQNQAEQNLIKSLGL